MGASVTIAPPVRPTSSAAAPSGVSRERPQPLGGSIGRTRHGCQGQPGVTRGAGDRPPAPGTAPSQCDNRAGTTSLRGERDPLQGLRHRVPRRIFPLERV